MNKKKRGVSPLIATILIIGFTVVLAVFIINWGSSFVKTLTEKQSKTSNLGLECAQLQFKIDYIKIVSIYIEDKPQDAIIFSFTNNIDRKIDNITFQIVKKDNSIENILNTGTFSLDPYQTLVTPDPLPLSWIQGISEIIPNDDKLRMIPQLKIDDELMNCPIEYSEEKIIGEEQ